METTISAPNHLEQRRGKRLLLQLGAVAAILGTVLQVAAGTSQSTRLGTAEVTLESLAGQPDWFWPTAYLGFIFGALLWVGALVALASSLPDGATWALGWLAVAAAIIGATLHAVDGALNAGGLASLARDLTAADTAERTALMQNGDLLLHLLDGTWAGVVTLFHGVPFVLAGLAVALSPRYPTWLGWVGVVGGVGSLVVGVAIFFGGAGAGLAVPFAVVLSLFMVALGGVMWSHARSSVEEPTVP